MTLPYIRSEPLDDSIINGKTEKDELAEIAQFVESYPGFRNDRGLWCAEGQDISTKLRPLFARPGAITDVSAVFVIRVINRRYLVSVSGQAHLRILRVHEGTNPTAFLMRENPLPPAPLRLSDYSCVGFRGYIGVDPGFDAILILRYPPKPNAPFRA